MLFQTLIMSSILPDMVTPVFCLTTVGTYAGLIFIDWFENALQIEIIVCQITAGKR